MSALKSYFLNLNIFASNHDNNEQETDQQRRWNIIGTRIYILVLILILVAIGLALSLINETTKITIENPTKEQINARPTDAKCVCSQISIPYRKFTSLEVNFHQICSSDFITNRWITAINSGVNTTYFFGLDFRLYGSAQFQALAGFCRLSKANTNQSIDSFYSDTLLSSEVLSKNVLQSRTQASINQFQSTASNTFRTQLRLINYLTVNNGLITSLGTNSFYTIFIDNQNMFSTSLSNLKYTQEDGTGCDCRVNICNKTASGIFNVFGAPTILQGGQLQFYIPGISSGCLPVTSILVSTLECFHNQSCVDQILSYFSTREIFQALSILNQSVYNPQSTIQSIVDNLMIENWITNISYEKYYSECAPSSCIYLKTSRYTNGFIIKKLVSSFAGLILILGFAIPFIIKIIQRSTDRTPKPKISLFLHIRQLKNLIQKLLVQLNLFKHYPSSDRQIRYQRYATRFHLFCIIISVIILTFYTFMIKTIQSKTILNPTEFQYNQLQQEYSQSLSCPCTSISMFYSHFITIQPQYHQVCSSDFVSDQWIEYIKSASANQLNINSEDYKANAAGQFKLLAIFCEQSQQIITDAVRLFVQTKFFSLQILPQETFRLEINSVFQNWKLITTKTFLTIIQLFQATIQGNRLNNNLNFGMKINPITGALYMGSFFYSNCTCTLSALCHAPASIFQYDRNSSRYIMVYTIPNFFTGCFQITSLLSSTLECFYNISCMLQIDTYLNSMKPFNFSALNSNLNLANETIGVIVNKLMVNEWLANISFTSYYNTCAPVSCTYQYEGRNNLLVILTTIFGIFGGLSLGFKLLISIGLQLIDKIMVIGLHSRVLLQSIRYIFTCNTEHKVIHRLHFIFVIITLTILYIFSGFTPSVTTVAVNNLTVGTYKKLIEKSYDSLQCSCAGISIKHQVFLNITPRFHEICSSDFISDRWISYLYGDSNPVYRYWETDFLYSANGQFQILASFCRLSQETVENALIQLGSSDLINTELLSFDLLNERIQKTMMDFQRTMPKLFINTLSLIRETIGANMLLSGIFNNWILSLPLYLTSNTIAFRAESLEYNECYCGLSSKCVSPSRGMLAGCYALETILHTTIQCFYNQTCIDFSSFFTAINTSSLSYSRFSLNSTIESIVSELMVEELLTNISYETYFNTCAPVSCTYSYTVKYNIIEGITTLIDLYGGIFIICQILSILVVKSALCFKQRIHPITD